MARECRLRGAVSPVRGTSHGGHALSHEWDSAYAGDPPPWDIGSPQPIVVAIADAGGFTGDVLDSGCGTGENALFLASRGFKVTGVDWSGRAIERARAKAAERGLEVDFIAADALALSDLGRSFDSVVDSGLFHTFDDGLRAAYVRSLAGVVRAGGLVHLLCFSELEPGSWGPRRVTQQELRDAFADGWMIEAIDGFRFATRNTPDGARAWHATIRRSAGPAPQRP
jgi:SAM-dependent methyltransferase